MADNISTGVHPPFFDRYISLVESGDLPAILEKQLDETRDFFLRIPADKWMYRYDDNKWTIKEVLQHIIDTERVFSFRALAFSRKDPNSLPSFNENEYAKNANANERVPNELVEEFLAVRKASVLLFSSFSDAQLGSVGKASNQDMAVRAIGYIIAGHLAHHVQILKERYLAGAKG